VRSWSCAFRQLGDQTIAEEKTGIAAKRRKKEKRLELKERKTKEGNWSATKIM
jgi:hypothetical protein